MRCSTNFYGLLVGLLTASAVVISSPATGKQPGASGIVESGYIVELNMPGLAEAPQRAGISAGVQQLRGMAKSGALMKQPQVQNYLQELELQREQVITDAGQLMGHALSARHTYSVLLNGFSVSMTTDEARQMQAVPGVKSVVPVEMMELHLDSSPAYIGAPDIWNGASGPSSRGEDVIIGIIDSGINWDSPFFSQQTEDGYIHINPRGQFLGLCNDPAFPEVECNNKLIGIYDFTTEGDRNGFDTSGHGSHVASIAAGNPLSRSFTIGQAGLGPVDFNLSGVAPRANLITYKVCAGQGAVNSSGDCDTADILAGLDQALLDGVDVINLSLGASVGPLIGDRFSPWFGGFITGALLELRDAGVLPVASAGNSGSASSSISTPAHAPWVMASGNITDNTFLGKRLLNLSGGDTSPPSGISGAGIASGVGPRAIVHASDFGNALCGAGPPALAADCGALTGASNPFPAGTFSGEIVVCDNGNYGRVEKGFNVMQAGAGGYILANTDATNESINQNDEHCLPAIHVGDQAGDALREWLATGVNHSGRIGSFDAVSVPASGAQLAESSSRGPNPEIPGVLKPNVVTPGTFVFGADNEAASGSSNDSFQFLSGTSMSSPHTAGLAALIMSARPGWSIPQVVSSIETTSVWPGPGSLPDSTIGANERGAGLPVAGQSVRAGLYLPVTTNDFLNANPTTGGNPAALNLSGVRFDDCVDECSLSRTVADQMGGGSWQVSTDQSFLSVSPSSFTLGANQQQTLTITANLTDNQMIGSWQTASVLLSTDNAGDGQPLTQRLPVAVEFSAGNLPPSINILTTQTRGRLTMSLSDLAAMNDATWQASRLIEPTLSTGNLPQDPTRNDPYDSNAGRRVEVVNVPPGTLRLRVETLASTADDVDLYVGLDLDGDNQPDAFEEQCASISIDDLEECEFDFPAAGNYWILLQNWQASPSGNDNVRARYAALSMPGGNNDPNLFINAPSQFGANTGVSLDIAWDAGTQQQGDNYWGAVALGTNRETPGNVGVFAVTVERDGDHQTQTLPLFDGLKRDITLPGNDEHDLAFIDVPDNATELNVHISGDNIELQAVRVTFDEALANQPLVAPAPPSRAFSVPSNADGEISLNVTQPELLPGRWYLIPRNIAAGERTLSITASLAFDDTRVVIPRETAYAREGGSTRQGIDFGRIGTFYGALWFTFDNNGNPMFFGSSAAVPEGGDRTFSGLLRTPVSDGTRQQQQAAGRVGITILSEQEMIYSYDLLGESGSERMRFLVNTTCPSVSGGLLNVNGVWDIPPAGRGGVSMAVTQTAQGYLRYFFDDAGRARWVSGRNNGTFTQNPDGTVFQASGFCPLCPPVPATVTAVGTYQHSFTGNDQGTQTISFELQPPLSGGLNETVGITKLSDAVQCR